MATSAQVQQLYIALLGRAADKPGLDWWLENINGGERTLEQAAAAFTTSEEFVSTYGSLQGAELVTAVYSNLFERTPSQEEVTYWVNDGRPADQLLAAFLAYASPADQTVINNKVTVAQYYTEAAGSDIDLDAAAAIVANVDGSAKSVSDALLNLPVSQATLTAGLAELSAAKDSLESFLIGLDLDEDGEADTDVAATADTNLDNALSAAFNTVNNLVAGDYLSGNTVALNAALLANEEAQNTADLAIAQNNLTAAKAAVSAVTGLQAAITAYDAAVATATATQDTLDKAEIAYAAAMGTYNVDAADAAEIADTAANTNDKLNAGSAKLIDMTETAGVFSVKLGAGVTETTNPGISAVLTAAQAYVAALNADNVADVAVVTKEAAVVALDPTFGDDATAYADLAQGFTLTMPADADAPTATEVAQELSSLEAAALAAAEALADAHVTAPATASAYALLTDADGYITGYSYDDSVTSSTVEVLWAAGEAAAYNNFLALSDDYDAAVATTSSLYEAQAAAAGAVDTAENAITELADAVAALAALKELDADRTALEAAISDEELAIAVAGYDLGATGFDFADAALTDLNVGADDDEYEIYTADLNGGHTIANGDFLAGDLIAVGGFTFNDGAADTDGNNSVLEFFVEEDASNLVVTFENVDFGSNAAAPEVVTITLTGLSLEDVVIGSNYITVA